MEGGVFVSSAHSLVCCLVAAYKYAAFQAFAIPTEGDNDADQHTHAVEPKPLLLLNDEQVANITALADEVNVPIAKICAKANVSKLEAIPALAYTSIINKLNAAKESA